MKVIAGFTGVFLILFGLFGALQLMTVEAPEGSLVAPMQLGFMELSATVKIALGVLILLVSSQTDEIRKVGEKISEPKD